MCCTVDSAWHSRSDPSLSPQAISPVRYPGRLEMQWKTLYKLPLNRCGNTTCCQRRSSECPESQILSVAHFLAWVRYIAHATQSLSAYYMISSASCNYWRFGSGGRQENINAICILRLNIINDKVRSTSVSLKEFSNILARRCLQFLLYILSYV